MALQFISIYEDRKGSWMISIPARYSVYGKRKFIHTDRNGIGYDSYNFALRDAIKIDDDIAHKGKVDPTLYTSGKPKKFVMKHFAETWLDSKTDITAATIEQYRYALKLINEHLGEKDLRCYTPYEGVEFKRAIQHLTPSTQQRYISIVNDIFECANEWHGLTIPKIKGVKQRKPDRVTVTEELRRKLLDRMSAVYYPIFRFIFYTGCRPSEAVALRYPYIDWKNRTAYIGEHISADRVVTGTKEGRGNAIRLDCIEDITPMLRGMYEQSGDKMGHVFLNKYGRRHHLSSLGMQYRSVRIGLTNLRLTDIARSYVINYLLEHESVQATMAQAKHSDMQSTLKYVRIPKIRYIGEGK